MNLCKIMPEGIDKRINYAIVLDNLTYKKEVV